ncbi:hypothetical protein M3Y99_00088700 [Aphelenchoides fujianensis]|nr:hypothetical protein M3Y99_00088700 [Aphelenchoides fujianensis]
MSSLDFYHSDRDEQRLQVTGGEAGGVRKVVVALLVNVLADAVPSNKKEVVREGKKRKAGDGN